MASERNEPIVEEFLPNSKTLEGIVISTLLINDTSSNVREMLFEELLEEDFYNKSFLLIFQGFKKYFSSLSSSKAYNLNVFLEFLVNQNIISIGNENEFLEKLYDFFNDWLPSEDTINAYVVELKEYTVKRKMIELGIKTIQEIKDEKGKRDIHKIIESNIDSMNRLNSINTNKEELTTGKTEYNKLMSVFDTFGDTISSKLIIPSYLNALDDLIKGFKSNELSIIAARPSCGKTALATTIILNMLSNPCPCIVEENGELVKKTKQIRVAFFSLEMDKESILRRLFSSYSYVPASYCFGLKSIKDTKYLDRMNNCKENLSNILQNLILYDKSDLTITKLKILARELKENKGVDIIFIDYLTLIKTESKNKEEWQSIAEISFQLKNLAKELEMPIVVLSQLNREAEEQEPKLSNLRNSGAIEQDADLVVLLHDPNRNSKSKDGGVQRVHYRVGGNSYVCINARTIKAKVSKQRNGMTGSFNLMFLTDYVKFVNVEDCTIDNNLNYDDTGVNKV